MITFKQFLIEELKMFKWLNVEWKFMSQAPRSMHQAIKELKHDGSELRALYDQTKDKFYIWPYENTTHEFAKKKFNLSSKSVHLIIIPDLKTAIYDKKLLMADEISEMEIIMISAQIKKFFHGYKVKDTGGIGHI